MPDWCPTCVNLKKPWDDPVCKECLQQSLPFGKKSPTKYEKWKKTNYDRVIHMSPKELAEIMAPDCPPGYPYGKCDDYVKWDGNLDCPKCWLDWLKQEVEDNA